MTVAELIEALKAMPGDAAVLFWGLQNDDGTFLTPVQGDPEVDLVRELPSGNFTWDEDGQPAVIL